MLDIVMFGSAHFESVIEAAHVEKKGSTNLPCIPASTSTGLTEPAEMTLGNDFRNLLISSSLGFCVVVLDRIERSR